MYKWIDRINNLKYCAEKKEFISFIVFLEKISYHKNCNLPPNTYLLNEAILVLINDAEMQNYVEYNT